MGFNFYWSQSRDVYDWLVFGCSLVLAGVGIWGVIVAVRTLKKIERQTKATEKAAEAALKQAEHLIAAERPFLMIEATGFEFVEIQAWNRGRSPAQIIFYNNFPNITTPLISEDWNPDRKYGYGYDIDGMEIINIQWLAPGGSMVIGSYELNALKEGDPQRWEEVRALKRWMYLWSAVKYRGLSGDRIYESRYCYRVRSAGPQMAGPPGLNSYL